MKVETPGIEIAEEIIADLRGFFSTRDPALTVRFADLFIERAKRVHLDRDRLADALGVDHPRVVALDTKLDRLQGLGADLKGAAEDQACVSTLGDREWKVLGVVADSDGNPLAGMHVRLVADDGSQYGVLKAVTTDSRGEFEATYHVADLNATTAPAFSVVVRDGAGKAVFQSPEPIEPFAGTFTKFSIVLSQETLNRGAVRTQCAGQTAKGAQCRNMAIPGSTYCGRHGDRSSP